MAIYKTGTFVVPASNAALNLNLGFIPSEFRMWNITRLSTTNPITGAFEGWWNTSMAAQSTPFSMLGTWTAGANVWSKSTTNGINPFTSPDSKLFVPNDPTAALVAVYQANNSTFIPILTGISKAANAVVTTTHSFQTADIGVTKVTFHNIQGMTQINNLTGTITAVTGTTSFSVDINTTNFSTFSLAGSPGANVITGAPVTTLYGNQILNTAEANLGFTGLTIGTDFMNGSVVSAGDTYYYSALLQSPATGP